MNQATGEERSPETPGEGGQSGQESPPVPSRLKPPLPSLRALRARLLASAAGDPSLPKDKKHRPAWVLRMACTAVDLGTVAIVTSSFLSFFSGSPPAGAPPSSPGEAQALSDSLASASLIVLVPAYYMFWEWFAGRTPGKMVLGLKMISTSGELSRGRMVWRGLARFMPLLQLFMVLSWRRVTFLDLITGTRVQSVPRSRPSLHRRTPSSAWQRGYDENLSQR